MRVLQILQPIFLNKFSEINPTLELRIMYCCCLVDIISKWLYSPESINASKLQVHNFAFLKPCSSRKPAEIVCQSRPERMPNLSSVLTIACCKLSMLLAQKHPYTFPPPLPYPRSISIQISFCFSLTLGATKICQIAFILLFLKVQQSIWS